MDFFVKHARTLSSKQRNALPDSTFAGPNRSFPVPDKAHVTAARRLLGRYKGPGDKEAIKARIESRAKALGMPKSAAACGYEAHHKYASFVPEPKNSAVAPNPTPAGKVPAPTPFATSPLSSSSKGLGGGSTFKPPASPASGGTEKKAMDDFLAGILGAGAGGVGGYALGKKFLDPMLGRKAQQAEEVARRLRKGQALAPLGAAALGALVLAAIAAANARKNERAKMEKEFFLRQQIKDSPVLSRYGITANEILPVNRGFY